MNTLKSSLALTALLLALGLAAAAASAEQTAAAGFYLHDGDHVVMLGDSITNQRFYTMYVETYVTTRFPKLKINWTVAGQDGDSIDNNIRHGQRLEREVMSNQPTVLTIMLGMNDGWYKPFDQQICDTYLTGYEKILKTVSAACPNVRYTLMVPSPCDEINHGPKFPEGYNSVLLRYGQALAPLAGRYGNSVVADLNTPMTAMLQKAHDTDAKLAKQIIPDQIHPSAAGHLVMAEALLKAWNAPALVSAVVIDAAAKNVVKADNTQVTRMNFRDRIEWYQMDNCLPMPYSEDLFGKDALAALVVKSSDFIESLDQETLHVTGLAPGTKHELYVDAQGMGVFTSEQLAAGINLATMFTPMTWQAHQIQSFVKDRQAWHATAFQGVVQPLLLDHDAYSSWDGGPVGRARLNAFRQVSLSTQQAMLEMIREAALPVIHHYSLTPVK